MIHPNQIETWNKQLQGKTPQEVIVFFLNHFKDKIALSTSMGLEDQVLTHMISEINKKTKIFTLDTGRLFPETYDLIDRTAKKYKITIEVFFPEAAEVEQMVAEKGINLFYDSIENRKLCCHLRKIKSLMRATKNLDIWITGLRHEQAITRKDLNTVEWDKVNGLVKINPLINWSEQQVWDYVDRYNVPVNPLHKKGFASIGCQPCTRAIEPGEDIRAGRWWWENPETKECGLHER
ncbi:MAG: phosphoadenosine phosphosulfate reductase [bacterium]|nr:MAG: phosphoadenosine phosphosulfate reductase [bacterium]